MRFIFSTQREAIIPLSCLDCIVFFFIHHCQSFCEPGDNSICAPAFPVVWSTDACYHKSRVYGIAIRAYGSKISVAEIKD